MLYSFLPQQFAYHRFDLLCLYYQIKVLPSGCHTSHDIINIINPTHNFKKNQDYNIYSLIRSQHHNNNSNKQVQNRPWAVRQLHEGINTKCYNHIVVLFEVVLKYQHISTKSIPVILQVPLLVHMSKKEGVNMPLVFRRY
jgi:hypothetical protein